MDFESRKIIRLEKELYDDPSIIFAITICVAERRKVFLNKYVADKVFATITGHLVETTTLYAACLMPDHVHLLISPKEVNLIKVVGSWKTYTAKIAKRHGIAMPLWQRSFFDKALRKPEDLSVVAEYILANPVRKDMCRRWNEYPYSYIWQQV